jgi:ATP-binding cassette subfamily E protein 1
MRIAVIEKKRCNPKKCSRECMNFCPKNRAGVDTVKVGEIASIDEETCIGCGICVKKCPFDAIHVINLPEQKENPLHQYGQNGFRIFNLPIPKKNSVVGLIGPNGAGKTTIMNIMAGELVPNFADKEDKERVIKHFAGTENQRYFDMLYSDRIKVSFKPQKVEMIPKLFNEKVRDLLEKSDERGLLEKIVKELEIENTLDKKPVQLSGGELQRVSIGATLMKDADLYIFDEPSSYLDIRQRINIAKTIRKFTGEKMVFVVEHDLILLDYLTDFVHVIFGKPAVYGTVSQPMSNKEGINAYIEGFLPMENLKFREEPLKFVKKAAMRTVSTDAVFDWGAMSKKLGDFELKINPSNIKVSEMVGCIGPNGIGKTTFARILAGEIKPDKGATNKKIRIAYKPQYVKSSERMVRTVLKDIKLLNQLNLTKVMDEKLSELSGGELQRVAIGATLSREADVYVFDEPSAHLDVEERINSAKTIKNLLREKERAAIVIDHDIMLLDYLSDRLLVFHGTPGLEGETTGPMEVNMGMNDFLKKLGITFRRDEQTFRPRANKEGSVKDREQKKAGKFYV